MSKKISNNFLDDIYLKALENGATGGKVIGSGGGVFPLLCSFRKSKLLIKALNKLTYVPFEFDNSGSKVVVYEPYEEENLHD